MLVHVALTLFKLFFLCAESVLARIVLTIFKLFFPCADSVVRIHHGFWELHRLALPLCHCGASRRPVYYCDMPLQEQLPRHGHHFTTRHRPHGTQRRFHFTHPSSNHHRELPLDTRTVLIVCLDFLYAAVNTDSWSALP